MENQMTNIATIIENGYAVKLSNKVDKNGQHKTGSFARAIVFATKEVRAEIGLQMYATWLANGNFKPLIKDIIDVLVPKSAQPFIGGLVPAGQNCNRDTFVKLCEMVDKAVQYSGKEPKGQKAFLYGIVQRVVDSANPETVENQA
jgi:hypothetical protein